MLDIPARKQSELLRGMWISLANDSAGMSAGQLTEEIASIEEIQNGLAVPSRAALRAHPT